MAQGRIGWLEEELRITLGKIDKQIAKAEEDTWQMIFLLTARSQVLNSMALITTRKGASA